MILVVTLTGIALGLVALIVTKRYLYEPIDCHDIQKSFAVLAKTSQKSPKTALKYRDQFSECGSLAIEFCRNLLLSKTASAPEIIEATFIISSTKSQADAEILVSYISHPNEEVRIAVAGQLKAYDVTKLGDVIASALRVEQKLTVKVLLVSLLASTANPKYSDMMEQLEKDSRPTELDFITPFGSLRHAVAKARLRLGTR
jgi:hypothetical protein